MQVAVLTSLVIILAIIYVPILDPLFDTTFLDARDWLIILPLIFMPAVAAEITKLITRREVEHSRPAAV